MNIHDTEMGVEAQRTPELEKVLGTLSTDLLFTPGSQPKYTIQIDTLKLLIQAARDGKAARALYESALLASEELMDTGKASVAPELGKAIDSYIEIHPELSSDYYKIAMY